MGIPLWYMLCTSYGYRHEQYALAVTLKVIFEGMNDIRPNALVIDKSNTELNVLINIVKSDPKCWSNVGGGDMQQSVLFYYVGFMLERLGWIIYCQKLIQLKETSYMHRCAN